MNAKEVIQFAREREIKAVDLRFCDLPGLWQHFTVTSDMLDEDSFEEGFGFDGSSIRGFQKIQESDMLLFPDPESAFEDPFTAEPTLVLFCNVGDPITGEPYSRDPRYVATKAEKYLQSTGIADTVYFGPEPEFFVFDDIRFEVSPNRSFHQVDSVEGPWNTARDEQPNLGYKPRYKEGYFPVPPMDSLQDIRTEMMLLLKQVGIEVEVHHHEVGSGGQCEIDMRFDTLRQMGDNLLKFKYIIKNVARRHNKTVTLMPKPVFTDNGSGMHCHQSLWKDGKNLFYQAGTYADLSREAVHYIGGILKHAPSLLAFCAPTTNSYRRLVPGYEAPINLIYSQRNRSACVRIPAYSRSEKSKRIEFRSPDPSANGYLAFAAMMMAGLDGIQNKVAPPDPMDKDLYDLEPEEMAEVANLPASLEESLAALKDDHDYLLQGDVFTSDLIESWLEYKWKHEVEPMRLRPHPYEFALYFDI
ncbi:MAG TPA: type I glutamate--ammonia ligase [Acidobacteriota bacterium]|nr:type I glutamate--ammonia ligase [Acidobacteriota bacterium]